MKKASRMDGQKRNRVNCMGTRKHGATFLTCEQTRLIPKSHCHECGREAGVESGVTEEGLPVGWSVVGITITANLKKVFKQSVLARRRE